MIGIDRKTGRKIEGFKQLVSRITQVMTTPLNGRVKRKGFGSRVRKYLGANMSDGMLVQVQSAAIEAFYNPVNGLQDFVPGSCVARRHDTGLSLYFQGEWQGRKIRLRCHCMFPHQNPLPKPEIIVTPPYEELLVRVKKGVLDHLKESAPDDVAAVRETLENEAELLTKTFEALTYVIQNFFRQVNGQAQQMFGMYATDTAMVDLIVSRLGVKRQVVKKGDPNAFPPVLPIMETNESVLTRYYLAAYALASTGTRGGYRFHAMTLGGRPKVEVVSPEVRKVIVTYEFEDHKYAGLTKDAQARCTVPGSGKVDCYILAHKGRGIPDQPLIDATQEYMQRDDIAQESDELTVKAPTVSAWRCRAALYIRPGPDAEVIKSAAEEAVKVYGKEQHRLGGRIEPFVLDSVLAKATGAHRGDITEPAQPIRCSFSEAPYLESVEITIITENV